MIKKSMRKYDAKNRLEFNSRHPKMKRAAAFFLLLALTVSLCGCGPVKPFVDVVTVTGFDIDFYHDRYYAVNELDTHPYYQANEPMKFDEIKYYAVGAPGAFNGFFQRINETDAFEPDDEKVYTVVPGGIVWRSYENNRGHYAAADKRLFDENGKIVGMTDALSDVFDSILKLEPHEIVLAQIFEDGSEYFVCLELNANWFYPCELYHYDKGTQSLKLVVQFDNERIVGVRLPK